VSFLIVAQSIGITPSQRWIVKKSKKKLPDNTAIFMQFKKRFRNIRGRKLLVNKKFKKNYAGCDKITGNGQNIRCYFNFNT
jgi:hypothetical protein